MGWHAEEGEQGCVVEACDELAGEEEEDEVWANGTYKGCVCLQEVGEGI